MFSALHFKTYKLGKLSQIEIRKKKIMGGTNPLIWAFLVLHQFILMKLRLSMLYQRGSYFPETLTLHSLFINTVYRHLLYVQNLWTYRQTTQTILNCIKQFFIKTCRVCIKANSVHFWVAQFIQWGHWMRLCLGHQHIRDCQCEHYRVLLVCCTVLVCTAEPLWRLCWSLRN